jgi:hypothetical protein
MCLVGVHPMRSTISSLFDAVRSMAIHLHRETISTYRPWMYCCLRHSLASLNVFLSNPCRNNGVRKYASNNYRQQSPSWDARSTLANTGQHNASRWRRTGCKYIRRFKRRSESASTYATCETSELGKVLQRKIRYMWS